MIALAVILASQAKQPVFPTADKLAEMGMRIAITLVMALIAQRALFLLAGRLERFPARAGYGGPQAEQRAKTLGQIFRNVSTIVVGGFAFIHILAVLGWDVRPVLAGAGIVGIAVGFGAQTLVRDIISGILILAEDQYGVGDLIEINGKPATVEAITVRSTTLRDFSGYVYYVPNGEIKMVVNRSRGWNRMAVDIVVPPGQDPDRALAVCRSVASAMSADPEWRDRLLDPIDVWGVESFGAPDVYVRMAVRTRPGPDLPDATRELRLRALRALGEAGIRAGAGRAPQPLPPASEAVRSAHSN